MRVRLSDLLALLLSHILRTETLILIAANVCLSILQRIKKKKSPQCDCPPSYLLLPATRLPHMALCVKPRCASDVQLAVLCDETLDSISSLSELCVQTFHSTSERLLPSM